MVSDNFQQKVEASRSKIVADYSALRRSHVILGGQSSKLKKTMDDYERKFLRFDELYSRFEKLMMLGDNTLRIYISNERRDSNGRLNLRLDLVYSNGESYYGSSRGKTAENPLRKKIEDRTATEKEYTEEFMRLHGLYIKQQKKSPYSSLERQFL